MNDEGLRFTPTGRLRKGQDLVMVDSIEEAVANQERRSEPRGEGLRERLWRLIEDWRAVPRYMDEEGRTRHDIEEDCADRIEELLLAATPPAPALDVGPQRVDEPYHEWHLRTGAERDETCYYCNPPSNLALAPERQEPPVIHASNEQEP